MTTLNTSTTIPPDRSPWPFWNDMIGNIESNRLIDDPDMDPRRRKSFGAEAYVAQRLQQRVYLNKQKRDVYLTKREAEVVRLLMQHVPIKQIGPMLRLSIRTIEYYIKNIKRKLKCHTRSELISKILRSDFE